MKHSPWLVLFTLCLGFFMILLDTTIVNIAIPDMIDRLDASLDQILWILNAYILVYAVLLITAGRLGDLFGPKRLFIIGLVVFTLASAACGIAQNPGQLIIFRIIQGIGGALLTPQTLSVILNRAAEIARSKTLSFLAASFGRLPSPNYEDRRKVLALYNDTMVLMTCSYGYVQRSRESAMQLNVLWRRSTVIRMHWMIF